MKVQKAGPEAKEGLHRREKKSVSTGDRLFTGEKKKIKHEALKKLVKENISGGQFSRGPTCQGERSLGQRRSPIRSPLSQELSQ